MRPTRSIAESRVDPESAKLSRTSPSSSFFENFGVESLRTGTFEADNFAFFQFLEGANECAPEIRAFALMQRRLYPRRSIAPDAAALKARRNDPRIIDDENIAGRQKVRQVAHAAVFEG